jgi:hypothetical protein
VHSIKWLATGYDCRPQEVSIFTMSTPNLYPTQSDIQWMRGVSFFEGSGQSVKLTSYLHSVMRLRIGVALPPLPHTSAWLAAQARVQYHTPSPLSTSLFVCSLFSNVFSVTENLGVILMNSKGCERRRSLNNLRYRQSVCLEWLRKTKETSE